MGNPIFDELFFQKNEKNEKPKNFFGHEHFWKKIGLFGTSTAPERSEKGLGRSGTIREHSEMTWNAWNWLKMTKYHPKIIRKHQKNLHRWPSRCHFSDFPYFLEGRLPPEDGSDRAENLTRSVSDEIAKNIFLARTKKSGCHFSNFPSILGFLQFERFDILGFLQFERFDIWASCSSSVLTFGLFAVRPFWHLCFLQFDRFDICASCSSTVLTFGLFALRPFWHLGLLQFDRFDRSSDNAVTTYVD